MIFLRRRPRFDRLARAHPRPNGNADREPAIHPALLAAVAVVIIFLVAGVFWPHAADGLLRILLATLAIGFVGVRASRVIPPMAQDPYSPFERRPLTRTRPAAPQSLRKLISQLEAAERAPYADAIPAGVRITLREELTRRLSEHHGLEPDEPADRARIRSLVSEPTWGLVRPRATSAASDYPATRRGEALSLTELGRILDDLENL